MNGTPRLRSAFPTSPQTLDNRRRFGSPASASSKLPPVSSLNPKTPPESPNEPLIPIDTIDAATQRLLVFSFYVALWGWRLYDFYALVTNSSTESLWLFMKWVGIDGVVLFGLPALRIPWLEFSAPLVTFLFLGHVLFNGMLMFKVGLPITIWLEILAKGIYDRELSISEHKVKPAQLFDSSSLISGKQVINILPEGSAILNPNRDAFCLGGAKHTVDLPIQINQTQPILIELLRVDLDNAEMEVLTISASKLKSMRKAALSKQNPRDASSPLLLHHTIRKPGYYALQKIVDESKLEVRPRQSNVVVVQCPQARVLHTGADKCKGELSNIAFEVIGTPPLKVKYRKTINDRPSEASFQSIQPDDFISPLIRQQQLTGTVVKLGEIDASWARAQRVLVPVNETLFNSGRWWYAIDEVQDAIGNTINYVPQLEDYEQPKAKITDQQQLFTVHERPRISLQSYGERGCDLQHPLMVARGEKEKLPVKFDSEGKGAIMDTSHTVEYVFTAEEDLLPSGDHNPEKQQSLKQVFKNTYDSLRIGDSGLYSLTSVATDFCPGEVMEPASCLLQNPPEPTVTFGYQNVTDKCAGNPVGLDVTMDFVGTPPFEVHYIIKKKGSQTQHRAFSSQNHRGQLHLQPPDAGHYSYSFSDINDRYYRARKFVETIEQTVKPSASAHFETSGPPGPLCLYEEPDFGVRLGGEGPWNLEYELVHNGQRKKYKLDNIKDEHVSIKTDKLENGGDYTLALTSVEAGGCKQNSQGEVTFKVRHQRPKASFGLIDGKRNVHTLEGKPLQIPLRLTGERPWTIEYANQDALSTPVRQQAYSENFMLEVADRGTYELKGVRDSACPGVVEDDGNQFKVEWIERPQLFISDSPTVERKKDLYEKKEVCEGDEDFVELSFTGNAPFDVRYEEHAVPEQGQKSLRKKELTAALGAASIQLETSKAGKYAYKFTELADNNYDHSSKRFTPLVLGQRVNPRPSAKFAHPGKTYSFCTVQDSGEDTIPVSLSGIPPFHLEVEIRHSGTAKPEILSIPNIATTTHALRLPPRYLQEGHSHLSIRKVRDSRGCQSKIDTAAPGRVQISVHDPPTITALDVTTDYCVGDYLNFRLSGAPPFTVYYTFRGKERKATATSTQFRRIADEPGEFVIKSIGDSASECRAMVPISKTVHAKPRGNLSNGKTSIVDIHEGSETELVFTFEGTPPFEFTYIRSETPKAGKKAGQILETRTERTEERTASRMVSTEGSYELVSVKDAFCLSSKMKSPQGTKKGQKLLMN